MLAEITSLTTAQSDKLDRLLQSNNPPMKCPNHPTIRSLDADTNGVHCTRCDHKWPVHKIPENVLSQIQDV